MTSPDRLSEEELLRELQQAIHALPDAPLALQRAAIDLWQSAGVRRGSLLAATAGAMKRILAELSFDSWATTAPAHGMRSLRAPTRHLMFSTAQRDVDLRIIPSAQAFSIAGQILGPDDAGTVELTAQDVGDAPSHSTQLDALGEFRIEHIAPGSYVLTLHLGADEIVLPRLDLVEPAP